MPIGPFDTIPAKIGNKQRTVYVEDINEMRTALSGMQDAYDVAVAEGYTGTRGEWLASLVGPPGAGVVPLGSVATVGDLPASGNTVDDIYTVDADGHAYAWDGSAWVDLGQWKGDTGDLTQAQADTLYAPATTQGVETTVTDAVGEWWVHPLATYQDSPYPRTVFGAIAADGSVLACEFNHGTGKTKRYDVGTAAVDDHNVPALHVEAGRRPLLIWTNHAADNYLRCRVGSVSGDLGSLVGAPADDVDILGGASYAQIHKIDHLSDDDQDTFWVFTRRGLYEWIIQPVTVTQATGAVSFGSRLAFVQGGTLTTQIYCTVADAFAATGNQTLRVGMTFNPAQSLHAIYYFEIDCVTLAVTDPVHGGLAETLGTAFVPESDATPVVAEPAAGESRRLFYVRPGPDSPAVAYADWTVGNEDNATYKVLDLTPLEDNYLDPGSTGYAEAAYAAGMVDASGFVYEVIVQTPSSAPATTVEVGRRYVDASGGWFFRLAGTKVLTGRVVRGDASQVNFTSTETVPLAWGDVIGLRLTADVSGNAVSLAYSLDPLDASPTWTTFATTYSLGGVGVANGTAPLVVPSSNAAVQGIPLVYAAELRTPSGTVLAGVDWRTEWQAGESPFVDTEGRSWTLAGDATIVVDTFDTHTLGTAGPRVGHTAAANYIPGLAFPYPSHDQAVLQARSDGTTETVEKLRLSAGTYVAEVLATQATTDGRLIRPYVPINGGPFAALVTNITQYAGFTDYDGDIEGVS